MVLCRESVDGIKYQRLLRCINIPDFLKVAIAENEKVFVLIFQTLDIMSNTLGEVPDISRFELLSGESTVFVNTSKEKRPVVDKSPFSLGSCYYHLNSDGNPDILPLYANAAPEWHPFSDAAGLQKYHGSEEDLE